MVASRVLNDAYIILLIARFCSLAADIANLVLLFILDVQYHQGETALAIFAGFVGVLTNLCDAASLLDPTRKVPPMHGGCLLIGDLACVIFGIGGFMILAFDSYSLTDAPENYVPAWSAEQGTSCIAQTAFMACHGAFVIWDCVSCGHSIHKSNQRRTAAAAEAAVNGTTSPVRGHRDAVEMENVGGARYTNNTTTKNGRTIRTTSPQWVDPNDRLPRKEEEKN